MSVLVLDFGSQVTQLIARRVREAGVYCEIVPYNKAEEALAKKPSAIILSGGPASVTESDTPRAPQAVFEMGVPVLGICYGEMTMAAQLGGRVEAGHAREFGRADIHVQRASRLLEGLAEMQSYVDRGMTIDDMKRDIQRRHPERVRVIFRAPDPGKYPPAAVKKLRNAMSMSQGTFAQVIGVPRILVQSWERGVRQPSPLACRLLDTIGADPSAWLARLQSSNRRPSRRAG